MEKKYNKTAIALLIVALLISLAGCSNLFGTDDSDSSAGTSISPEDYDDLTDEEAMEVIDNGIEFEEESEDVNLHFRKSDELEYIGSWEATSGHSIYMYGVLELNILPGGKWNGTIVDEKMSGTWTFENNQMILTGEYFDATLAFTDGDKLVMQENRGDEEEEDIVKIVLTKKK